MAPFSDEYRELIETARDAIRDLVAESTPDAYPNLRAGYGELRYWIRRDDAEVRQHQQSVEAVESEGSDDDEWFRRRAWTYSPRERRETCVLEAIGDQRLTVREVTDRINWELSRTDSTLHTGHIRSLLTQMVDRGQLDRAGEQFRGKVRHRYFRRGGLDGPIADLERAYNEEED